MSKAEQGALKAYPIKIAKREGYDENLRERKGFVKGYNQAVKDNELTWDDIKKIYFLFKDVINEWSGHEFSDYGICREVLKRFNEYRNER